MHAAYRNTCDGTATEQRAVRLEKQRIDTAKADEAIKSLYHKLDTHNRNTTNNTGPNNTTNTGEAELLEVRFTLPLAERLKHSLQRKLRWLDTAGKWAERTITRKRERASRP